MYNGTSCVSPQTGAAYPPIVSEGNALLGPPWRFLLSAEYVTPLSLIGGRNAYARLDFQHTTAQTRLLPTQDPRNGINDPTIPGLPETTNLSARLGARFSGYDISLYGDNLTNNHPALFVSRDIASNSIDNLYYERSVRPLTIGITATYRF